MNDADKLKLRKAMAIVTNLEAHLSNLQSRGARASKFMANEAVKNKGLTPAQAKLVKDASVTIAKLTKEAPALVKVLRAAEKEALDPKVLSLSSVFNSNKFYPGSSDVDVQATMNALQDFSHYWNEIRVALAKV